MPSWVVTLVLGLVLLLVLSRVVESRIESRKPEPLDCAAEMEFVDAMNACANGPRCLVTVPEVQRYRAAVRACTGTTT